MFEWLVAAVDPIVNPKKRVFIGYLLSALAIAVLWLLATQRSTDVWSNIKQTLFGRHIWLSRSTMADGILMFGNQAIFILLTPFLITQLTLANELYLQWFTIFGFPPKSTLVDWQVMLLFTAVLFVLDDFSRFFLHWSMHKLPFLWAFHKIHHSATVMTPFTVLRTHPVEGILFYLRSACVQALVISFFIYCFDDQVDLVSILGASIFVFVFNVLGSNLRHSHVAIYYPKWLERWLISPAMHQLHHSTLPRHFDKNMGSILAIWDRMFGTLHHSEPDVQLRFGLDRRQSSKWHSPIHLYLTPFKDALVARKKDD